ncbi:MAG: TetR/AcrR family transcriptional regulator [Parasphingopyxis sp.]|uniref:TetR/AcrR family transcriptional regulator n=1 Tax=Parasphingopyxis sp. TaxID=1920299 RepID=UPI0032EE1B15
MNARFDPASASPSTERTARKILDAAKACFEHQGIEKTSMVDIATQAGYSRPIVYKHFANKDEVVDAVCIREMLAVQAVLDRHIPADLPFAERLTEVILRAVLLARDNPYLQRFSEDGTAWARSQNYSGRVHRWFADRWQAYLARAQNSGMIAEDVDIERIVGWIALAQSFLLRESDRAPMDEDEMRAFLRRFLIAPLLA